MPTPKKGTRFGGSPSHQKAILNNLATSLFEHGRITTTEAKARMLRPFAERLITKAKKGDLHNRRIVLRSVKDKGVVHALFTEIGPQFAERPGGYTRITKIGPRKGDNAPMAVIELVTESYAPKPKSAKPVAAVTPAPAEEPVAEQKVTKEPVTEEPVAEEPVTEEPVAEETATEEPATEEPAPEETVAEDALVGTVAEESAAEDAAKDAAEDPAEDPAEDSAEESAKTPAASTEDESKA